jgi:membrane protein
MALGILRRTLRDFSDDGCPRMAAAISYYTLFSLPPLLMLVLMTTGFFVDSRLVEQRIETEMMAVVGAGGAGQIREMIRNADRPGGGGALATVLSIGALLLGATGAFLDLQKALNTVWEVRPDPTRAGWLRFVTKRLLSLGMVLTIAFLLLVSLLVSAAVSALGQRLAGLVSPGLSAAPLYVLHLALSLAVIAFLFALSSWRDVWVGGFVTALLFVGGKFALGLYLSRSDPGDAFGAAGSLALILIWVYYSAMILFLGAEFTQAWAIERGDGIEPKEGAVAFR